MKKVILSVLLLAAPLATFAQLKVTNTGKVGIGITGTPLSNFAVGGVGSSETANYFESDKNYLMDLKCIGDTATPSNSVTRTGLRITRTTNTTGIYCGVSSDMTKARPSASNLDMAIGLLGTAGNAYLNYGVQGKLEGFKPGAAIIGEAFHNTPSSLPVDGTYAGYFIGDTKVDGLLTVTGGIDGDLMGTPTDGQIRVLGAVDETEHQSMGIRLQSLQTIPYYQQAPQRTRSTDLRADTTETEAYVPAIARQAQEHRHYGFSSEQMEEAFPELVYEKEDGTKLINYKELIPILVQSVNELNAEIARLKGLKDNEEARSMTNESEETAVSQISVTAPVLYQNTPNPFSERTAIRFSLPDNAQNAYIYIFDMTGKMQKQIPVDASMESVTINGYELSAGMYIYSLVVNGKEMDTKRMILSK